MPPSEPRNRKKLLRDGIVRGLVSVVLLAGAWLYDDTFLNSDSIMRANTDKQMVSVVLLFYIVGLIYSVLALRSFWRAAE